MPMRERSMKRPLSNPSFMTEKRRPGAMRLESDVSSCGSATTQSSASSLKKPEAISHGRKYFTPNALLQGTSRCLESLRLRVQEWRKARKNSAQATPEAAARARSYEIDASLKASAAGMEQNPTILVLGDCDTTREFMTQLQRSPQCIPAPQTSGSDPHDGDYPRRLKWAHLMGSSSSDIKNEREKFHLHIHRPGSGIHERKLSRTGRYSSMTAVVFVADISSYDETSVFDESCNRITTSLIWWDSVVNTRCFDFERTMPFILCFLGVDDFRRKLKEKPFSRYFRDFRGKDEQEALDYILARFSNVERVPRTVYALMIENGNENEVVAKNLVAVVKLIDKKMKYRV
ncbi:MAG: hypothetical protein Q9191_005167 [Dirinaria sp. TL-2023a]